MKNSNNDSLSERFRNEFIQELPECFLAIERQIMALDNTALQDALAALFRNIHNIKGSSATFGLQILASIYHPFEELIQGASESGSITKDFIEIALRYLDLLRECATAISHGKEEFDQIERQLANLHQQAFHNRFSIAVAVNSRMLRDICRQIGKSLDVRVIEFEDSLNALQRTLTEPINLLIASSELYPMRGEALIAALKLTQHQQPDLRTILISANPEKSGYVNRRLDPDRVVLRDKDFMSNMQDVVTEFFLQADIHP